MSPIEPTQVQQSPVDFKESSFSGGSFTPGKMANLPAKSSEQYMYESLSQIASGVQQGFNIFGDISERIDREKITKTETEWEKIDAQDIDPRDKVKQFNQYVDKVSTPMSGDVWKQRIANRMAKSWGKDAYEKFVSDEYTEQAKTWKEYDGKMGPVLTDRFLTEFEKNNPSLTGSDFLQSLRLQTDKQLENIQDQLVSNSLVATLVQTYSLPSDMVKGLVEGTVDLAQSRKRYPEAAKLIELATTTPNIDTFTGYMAREFYGPLQEQISNFNPETQLEIKLKMDQIFPSIVKDLWEKGNLVKQSDVKRSQQALALTSSTAFTAAPNQQTFFEFGKQSYTVLSNMAEMEQISYLSQMYQTTFKGLASGKIPGFENFTDLPPSKQIELVNAEFKSLLEKSNINDVLKTEYFPQFEDQDKLFDFIINTFKDSEGGQALQNSAINRVAARAEEIVQKIGLDPNIPIDVAMGRFVEEVSLATGVDKNIVKDFIFTESGFRTQTIEEIAKENPTLLNAFYTAGFTPQSLRAMNKSILDIKEAYDKRTTGSRTGTGLKEQKYQTEAEARQKLLIDTDEQRKALQIIKNPQLLNDLSEEARNDAMFLVQAVQKANIELRGVANLIVLNELDLTKADRELLTTETPLSSVDQLKKQKLLEDIDTKSVEMFGQSLDTLEAFDPQNPVNFNTFLDNTWVDKNTKNITTQGRIMGVRAAYYAREMTQNRGISGRQEFLSGLVDLVTTINSGEVPFNQQDPGKVYASLFMLQGLSFADQTQITSFVNQSKADHLIGTQFIRYLATKHIPGNLNFTDKATIEFLNVMETATRALAGGETVGLVMDPQQGRTINAGELATRFLGYGSGNLKNAYPEVKEYDSSYHTNNATKAMGAALGFQGNTPEETLDNIYTFLSPLFSPGSGIQSTTIPSPNYPGNLYVVLPNSDSPRKFSSLSNDDKLVYYLSVAGKTDLNQLKLSLTLGLVANNALSARKGIPTMDSPAARVNAVSALTTAGLVFNEVRGVRYDVPHYDIQFLPSRMGWFGTNWGENVMNMTPQSMIPSLRYTSETSERKSPAYVLPVITRQILGTSQSPSFEDLEAELKNSPNPEDSTLFEEFKKRFQTNAVMQSKSGVLKGLDPASQFVVGIGSLGATKQNIDYFLSTISESNVNSLEELGIPLSKVNAFYAISDNANKSVLEALYEIDPNAYKTVSTVLRDMKLGLREQNGIRFGVTPDREVAMLEFNQVRYDSDNNDNISTLVTSYIPELPSLPEITSSYLWKGARRYVKTLLLIEEIQNGKQEKKKQEEKIKRQSPTAPVFTPNKGAL